MLLLLVAWLFDIAAVLTVIQVTGDVRFLLGPSQAQPYTIDFFVLICFDFYGGRLLYLLESKESCFETTLSQIVPVGK